MENKQKVIITGGSRGIGAACVFLFAQNGFDTAFIYHKSDAEAAELCKRTGALAVKADISRPNEAKKAIEEAQDKLGGLDVLVNNAGIAQFALFTDITDGDWQRMTDTDLSGTFYCTRAALPTMISQKSGSIVNISSMWGITGASCEVHYSAAKAGIIGMTKALAKEVGPSGIRVNCVAPGAIDTEMNASLDEAARAALCDDTPLCRLGRANEVADAVYFLASEKASFITGQVLSVNGGYII